MEKEFDFDKFKKIFNQQLEFEFIVDSPIRGGNGEMKNDKPVLLTDHLEAYFHGELFKKFISDYSDKGQVLIEPKIDRKHTPKGSRSALPKILCELLIYAIIKSKSKAILQEKLREYLFNLQGEWSSKNNKALDFTIPTVPQSINETDDSYSWALKHKSRLLSVLKTKQQAITPNSQFSNKHKIKEIIEKYDHPKGFNLSSHDVNKYTMLK